MSPRVSAPTKAKGRRAKIDLSLMGVSPVLRLSRFSRSIGRCGRKTETILFITQLHAPTSHRHPPTTLERDVPTGRTRGVLIEWNSVAVLRSHAPARERAGKSVGA